MKERFIKVTVHDNDHTSHLAEALHRVVTTARGELEPELFKKFVVKSATFYSHLHHISTYGEPGINAPGLQHTYDYLLSNIEITYLDEKPDDTVWENSEIAVYDRRTGEISIF